jgi:hypothetical protein
VDTSGIIAQHINYHHDKIIVDDLLVKTGEWNHDLFNKSDKRIFDSEKTKHVLELQKKRWKMN